MAGREAKFEEGGKAGGKVDLVQGLPDSSRGQADAL
jgi:hypothetical protein